jgi:protein-tyrosine phosphatase
VADTSPGSEGRIPTSVRVLTVCTHNRTRSVMMAALLHRSLVDHFGVAGVDVRSGGFGRADLPAIADAVAAMSRRGLDVSGHRSRPLDRNTLAWADVILTAERDHVVRLASIEPAAFRRAMTLPEFVTRMADADWHGATDRATGPVAASPGALRDRLVQVTASRTAAGYLRDEIAEIDDPTGSSVRAFEAAVVDLESLCHSAATALADMTR